MGLILVNDSLILLLLWLNFHELILNFSYNSSLAYSSTFCLSFPSSFICSNNDSIRLSFYTLFWYTFCCRKRTKVDFTSLLCSLLLPPHLASHVRNWSVVHSTLIQKIDFSFSFLSSISLPSWLLCSWLCVLLAMFFWLSSFGSSCNSLPFILFPSLSFSVLRVENRCSCILYTKHNIDMHFALFTLAFISAHVFLFSLPFSSWCQTVCSRDKYKLHMRKSRSNNNDYSSTNDINGYLAWSHSCFVRFLQEKYSQRVHERSCHMSIRMKLISKHDPRKIGRKTHRFPGRIAS